LIVISGEIMAKKITKVYYKNLHTTEQYGKSTVEISHQFKQLYPEGYTRVPHVIFATLRRVDIFSNIDRAVYEYLYNWIIGKGRIMMEQDFNIYEILEDLGLSHSSIKSVKKSLNRLHSMNMIRLTLYKKYMPMHKESRLSIRHKKTKVKMVLDAKLWKLSTLDGLPIDIDFLHIVSKFKTLNDTEEEQLASSERPINQIMEDAQQEKAEEAKKHIQQVRSSPDGELQKTTTQIKDIEFFRKNKASDEKDAAIFEELKAL
jgi:hypothetical protein